MGQKAKDGRKREGKEEWWEKALRRQRGSQNPTKGGGRVNSDGPSRFSHQSQRDPRSCGSLPKQ